ncbi:hypothetical protein QQ045_014202 [Rhodiola kirilowii]
MHTNEKQGFETVFKSSKEQISNPNKDIHADWRLISILQLHSHFMLHIGSSSHNSLFGLINFKHCDSVSHHKDSIDIKNRIRSIHTLLTIGYQTQEFTSTIFHSSSIKALIFLLLSVSKHNCSRFYIEIKTTSFALSS